MNYKELEKLYPEFKIPYEKEADYYLHVMLHGNKKLQQTFALFKELEAKHPEITKYKFKKFDEIIAYFKTMSWELNNLDNNCSLLNSDYSEKDFNNYKPDKFYISIDLKEANWQAFKLAFEVIDGPNELLNFEGWSIKQFDLHPCVAQSKSFRQFLFGNTNPKRLQRIQKGMMNIVYNSHPYKDFIVGKKPDELIFEFSNLSEFDQFKFSQYIDNIPYQFKFSFFTISETTNFKEFVRIKNKFTGFEFKELLETKLVGVPGHRFFLHYKTLILKEPLDERDYYFVVDKQLAKWVVL